LGLSYNIEHFTSAGGLLDGRREFIRKLRQGIGHRDIPSLSLLGWKQLLQPLFGYFNERLRRLRPIRMYNASVRSEPTQNMTRATRSRFRVARISSNVAGRPNQRRDPSIAAGIAGIFLLPQNRKPRLVCRPGRSAAILHDAPVTVLFAVLLALGVTEKHDAAHDTRGRHPENGLGLHYSRFSLISADRLLFPQLLAGSKIGNPAANRPSQVRRAREHR